MAIPNLNGSAQLLSTPGEYAYGIYLSISLRYVLAHRETVINDFHLNMQYVP